MLKYYRESRLKHMAKSFLPDSVRFKPLREKVDEVSRAIDEHVKVRLHEVLNLMYSEHRSTSSALITKIDRIGNYLEANLPPGVLNEIHGEYGCRCCFIADV